MPSHGPNAWVQDYQYDSRKCHSTAHRAFDSLWTVYGMTRDQAYTWLRKTIGKGHIKDMSKQECAKLLDEVHNYTIRQADRIRGRNVRAAV